MTEIIKTQKDYKKIYQLAIKKELQKNGFAETDYDDLLFRFEKKIYKNLAGDAVEILYKEITKWQITNNIIKLARENFNFKAHTNRLLNDDEDSSAIFNGIFSDLILKNQDDHEKANWQLHSNIERTADTNACDWCKDLEYSGLSADAPGEVWSRHKGCICVINYENFA